jgi:hypothetical protein
MAADLYVATQGAAINLDGEMVMLWAGAIARAGHPVMAGREHLFVPLTVDFEVAAAPAGEQDKPAEGPGGKPDDSPDNPGGKRDGGPVVRQDSPPAAVKQPDRPAGQPGRGPKPGSRSGG